MVKFSFKPPDDIPFVHEFCGEMFDKMEKDDDYVNKIVFSDKATFHLNGKGSHQNVRIWGKQNPHEIVEQVRAHQN